MIYSFYLKSHNSPDPIRLEGDSKVVNENGVCVIRKNDEVVGEVDWADVICWHDHRAIPQT